MGEKEYKKKIDFEEAKNKEMEGVSEEDMWAKKNSKKTKMRKKTDIRNKK